MTRAAVDTKMRVNMDTAKAASNAARLSSKMGQMAKAAAATAVAFVGLRAINTFFKESIALGNETTKVYSGLEDSIKRAGISWKQAEPGLRSFTDQLQTMTGVADEEFAKATKLFIDLGFSVAQAMDAVTLSTDIAIAKDQKFVKITRLVAESFANEITSLKKWGVEVDAALPRTEQIAEAMRQLNDQVGGAAQANMETMAVQAEVLAQRFGDFQEQIGILISGPLLTLVTQATELIRVINSMGSAWQKAAISVQWFMSRMDPAKAAAFDAELVLINALLDQQAEAAIRAARGLEGHGRSAAQNAKAVLQGAQQNLAAKRQEAAVIVRATAFQLKHFADSEEIIIKAFENRIAAVRFLAAAEIAVAIAKNEDITFIEKNRALAIMELHFQMQDAIMQMHERQKNVLDDTTRGIRVFGDAWIQVIADIEDNQFTKFARMERGYEGLLASMNKNATLFAAKQISLQELVAKSAIDTAAAAVAGELEALAKLWAAKAIAAVFTNPAAAAGYAAAAALATGGAAAIRATAAQAFTDTQREFQDDAEIGIEGGGGSSVSRGRTVISQGPITLNYTAVQTIHGSIFGVEELRSLFESWNLDQLRAAGLNTQEIARA